MEQNVELQFIISLLQGTDSKQKELFNHPSFCWNTFYKIVIKHRVWHQAFAALTAQKIQPPIYKQLARRCEKDKLRIIATAGETLRIAHSFSENDIQHCFIKGTVLNEFLYGSLTTRPCRDIDIWVDDLNLERAADVLIALGYQKKAPIYKLSGFKQHYYMTHKHDVAFYHPQRKILIELHFRLAYFGINFFTQNQVQFKSVLLCNTLVQTLDDDYHLLYLMLHGASHAWVRLRWLNDIVLYIKSNRCSLARVMALAEKIHCTHIVEETLILIRDLFGINSQLLDNPSARASLLANMAKRFIASDYEFGGSAGMFKKEFFSYRFYLARLAAPGQKINAILGDLFKIDNVFPYVTFPYALRFLYYLVYPLWVVKYIVFRR